MYRFFRLAVLVAPISCASAIGGDEVADPYACALLDADCWRSMAYSRSLPCPLGAPLQPMSREDQLVYTACKDQAIALLQLAGAAERANSISSNSACFSVIGEDAEKYILSRDFRHSSLEEQRQLACQNDRLISQMQVIEALQRVLLPQASTVHQPSAADFDQVPYDRVYRPACHNCYERKYAESLTAALDRTTAIEVDFYDDANAVSGSTPGAWYVRHDLGGGNDNNCTMHDGRNDLRACLLDVAAWSDQHPGHPVITLFLDKKQGWGDGRRPVDLDTLLAQTFGARIYAPADLQGAYSSPRAAVARGAWPNLADLRTRVIVVLTGGSTTGLTNNQGLEEYVRARGATARAFVAPDVEDDENDVLGIVDGFSPATIGSVVFLNIEASDARIAALGVPHHLVSRVWASDDGAIEWDRLVGYGVNFIARYDLHNVPNAGSYDGDGPPKSLRVAHLHMHNTPQSGTWLMCFQAQGKTFHIRNHEYEGDELDITMNLDLGPVKIGESVPFYLRLDDDEADVCTDRAEDRAAGTIQFRGDGNAAYSAPDWSYQLYWTAQ